MALPIDLWSDTAGDPQPTTQPSTGVRRAALIIVAGYAALLALMLALGYTLTHVLDGSVGRWDQSVNRSLVGRRTPMWDDVTGTATWVVNTLPAIGLAAIITGVLALRRRWREAAMLVLALTLELLVFLSVTWVIARPRPDVPRLNDTPSTSSFPSGHTAAATVIFAGLAIIVTCCTRKTVVRMFFVVVAIAAATTIGFARVYRGLHYPTDVFSGGFLGAGCLVVAILAVRATSFGSPNRKSAPATANVETVLQPIPPTAARPSAVPSARV